MRRLMVLLALLLAAPLPVGAAGEQAVRVFKVFDGDTLLVRTRNHSQRVRLAGIDAPELDQPGGQFSLQVLEKMVAGQRVRITVVGEAAVGEALVQLWLRKYDIPLEMVRAGAAWVGPDGDEALREAEQQARAEGKGIWSAETPPMPPWQWRTEHATAQ